MLYRNTPNLTLKLRLIILRIHQSQGRKKRILIIDDEADKGWGELYKALFSHYSNIEVNTLKGFDYASDTKATLLRK